MADENTAPAGAGDGATNGQGPAVALQTVYIKDLSFEAPKGPLMPSGTQQDPKISLNLSTTSTNIAQDAHEVILSVTLEAKNGDVAVYLAEVKQAGLFLVRGFGTDETRRILGSFAPNLLFPYIPGAGELLVFCAAMVKVYRDIQGSVLTTLRARLANDDLVTRLAMGEAQLRDALTRFVGVIQQKPPAFSAMHIDGQRAYKLARKGKEVDIPARPVRIDAIELIDYAFPIARLQITCGKGTYIRSLARDLGIALNTGGHLASLRRTRVGRYDLSMAVDANRLQLPIGQGDLQAMPASA